MRSYCGEGIGLPTFLKKTGEVKEIIAHDFKFVCCFIRFVDTLCYVNLVEYVQNNAKKLFESNPEMVFQVQLLDSQKMLVIRVKNTKKEIVTILTVYFSECGTKAGPLCRESLRWSEEAFLYLFKE
jgi:hypothetical protein